MAKQNKQPSKGTTSVITNSFIKGMNKDITQSMEPAQSWWNARNAANNSNAGDMGVIGNEPSNLQCGVIPYTIIGAIHRYGDEWIIYSTDNVSSEIGRFDDSECKYTVIINDPCLAFDKKYLITGASKENFDCTWEVYWDDGNNPSRSLNIDNVPYKQEIVSPGGDPCIVYGDILPRTLNCEKIRLAPLVDTPCIVLEKATDGGMLQNGAYQAYIAYTENEQRVTDFIGISNIQTIWSHKGTDGSLDIHVSNLDKDYEFFELALLIRNQGQSYAKRIGLYSTERNEINLDYIDDSLIPIDLKAIPQRSPAYEKSEAMYVVNDWLIRQGPTEQFDFNYQPIANNITTSFVINQVQSKYYHLGGNKLSYLRDEQYAFFIRWIYNTGERSSSYHIPGRAPKYYAPAGADENVNIFGDNVLDTTGDGDPVFKVYNTGSVTSVVSEPQPDGSTIIAKGEMGYWESTERYPVNRPDIWGDLCGKPIRHHKMPAEGSVNGSNLLNLTTDDGDNINLLGVEFGNIGRPKYNDGTYLPNVVGYELLRGSRGGAKSILGKGLFRNMRKYTVPNAENLIGNDVQGLYPNYPYNDLRPDMYFHDGKFDDGQNPEFNRTEDCHNFSQSIGKYHPLGADGVVDGENTGYSQKVFTFSSPDLMFTKPFLNAYETRIYGDLSGNSSGYFKESEDHPQFKLIRNGAAIISAFIGVGYAMGQVSGTRGSKFVSSSGSYSAGDFYLGLGTGGTTGLGASAAANFVGAGASTAANAISYGIYELTDSTMALADLWVGGGVTETFQGITNYASIAVGLAPGADGGKWEIINNKTTPLSNMPALLRAFASMATTGTNISIGGNEIIELIYNLVRQSDFVMKYISSGIFNKFEKRTSDLWRIKNSDSNYLGQSFQSFDNGNYKINNLFRPSTVVVGLERQLDIPSVQDTSRFVIGGHVNANGSSTTYSNDYLLDTDRQQKRPISAHYGALKFNFDNQYGQLDGIKQVPMRGCVELLDEELPEGFMYTSSPIFSGDVFINRYTEKVMMPIFAQFLMGQPDLFTYDYSNHVNIPYPRYWLNSQKYDITKLAQKIATLNIMTAAGVSENSIDPVLPNDLFYLDRGTGTCTIAGLGNIFDTNPSDPNPIFAMRYAYMYSHSNGILDFFVESEINLAQRDWEDTKAKRIYDIYEYNDLVDLFHAAIQKIDNFYKYDESLSPARFPSQLGSWGEMQGRFYDPYVAENCYVARPKRLIYSLQAQEESKKDFWRVFLNFNYKDFKNKVNVIKPINKSGAIIFFPYLSPQMFQGLDTLKTGMGTKLTIGDGGLFSQPFQNVTNSDLSNEYGSCESIRGVINTPMGLFYISQAQGKIFQYAGKGLDPISNKGMKWWFEQYLPSQLVKQFPELEFSVLSDNPVVGVGCQSVYDPNDDVVYFMKRDYSVKDKWKGQVTYSEKRGFQLFGSVPITLGDPIYFNDASWTISYDPKAKAWISFHDWHPEFSLPSINHFFTTKTITTDVPQCPPGYNFNSANGLCEQSVNETVASTISVDDIVATITGGATNCVLDIVIAMDWSGSTVMNCSGSVPAYNPVTGAMGNTCQGTAQMRWLDVFLNNPAIVGPMATGDMQIGFTGWEGSAMKWMQPGNTSMSNTVTGVQAVNWYISNWGTGTNGTNLAAAMGTANPFSGQGGFAQLNDKANSTLGDRVSNTSFKQILIVVTDGTAGDPESNVASFQSPNVTSGAGQATNTGSWANTNLGDPLKQEVFGVFCGGNSNVPGNPAILDNASNSRYNTPSGPAGPNQFTMNAQNNAELQAVANQVAGSVCSIPFSCTCPAGYTKVFQNSTTLQFTETTGTCDDTGKVECRKVTCECPPASIPGTVTTALGTCPDSAPLIYLAGPKGDPSFVSDAQCNYFFYNSVTPNYSVGSIWRHNERCDSYANYYGVDYPWEVELVANSGQTVNTLRSIEYQLEAYVYKGVLGYACGNDKWEDLLFNFDQAVIYNNEQTSGLLQLVPTPFNNPILELTYPIVNTNNINILCSKVEQKYRFNQFWDITNDRGEFPSPGGVVTQQSIWNTELNGYKRNLNNINLNYFKSPLQHKKFRNYFVNVILRRQVSGDRQMLLRLNNTKLLTSLR